MRIARGRAKAALAAGAVLAAVTITASPAQAASCTSVPGSVTGTDVTILGERYRVPSISNIQVCTDGASAPLVGVETSGNGYDPVGDVPGCETVPDVYDSNGNSENFCDDPVGWVQLVVRELRSFCNGNCHPTYLVCQLTSPEPWNC